MVQHQHQPDPTATHTGHHRRNPQGTGPWQRLNDHPGGDIEQRLLIARIRARQQPHMPGRVEARVVHPHRAATPGRHPNQPLPQPRHGPDPLGQHLPDRLDIEPGARVEHEHSAEVLGYDAAALHRQQREIGRARTLDRNRVPGGPLARDDRWSRSHRTLTTLLLYVVGTTSVDPVPTPARNCNRLRPSRPEQAAHQGSGIATTGTP
jgi:hypothetical protein